MEKHQRMKYYFRWCSFRECFFHFTKHVEVSPSSGCLWVNVWLLHLVFWNQLTWINLSRYSVNTRSSEIHINCLVLLNHLELVRAYCSSSCRTPSFIMFALIIYVQPRHFSEAPPAWTLHFYLKISGTAQYVTAISVCAIFKTEFLQCNVIVG